MVDNCLQGKFLIKSETFFVSKINIDNLNDCLIIENQSDKVRSIRNQADFTNLITNQIGFGLFNNNKLIGYAFFSLIIDELELIDINLLKPYQAKGIGTQFLKNCAQLLKTNTIILEVAIDNIQAIKSYQKFNHEQIGIRKNYYNNKDGSKTNALVYKISL